MGRNASVPLFSWELFGLDKSDDVTSLVKLSRLCQVFAVTCGRGTARQRTKRSRNTLGKKGESEGRRMRRSKSVSKRELVAETRRRKEGNVKALMGWRRQGSVRFISEKEFTSKAKAKVILGTYAEPREQKGVRTTIDMVREFP